MGWTSCGILRKGMPSSLSTQRVNHEGIPSIQPATTSVITSFGVVKTERDFIQTKIRAINVIKVAIKLATATFPNLSYVGFKTHVFLYN